MTPTSLSKPVQVLLLLILIVIVLYYGKPFLVPLVFAALLSMLFLPICKWLQDKGINKAVAIIACLLIFLAFVSGVVWLITWQISDLAQDAPKIEQNLGKIINSIKQFITSSLGISAEKQQEMIQQQQQSSTDKLSGTITSLLTGLGSFLTNFIIVVVYMFLFLYYRGHLKQFVLKIVNSNEKSNAEKIIDDSSKVTQKYLTGLALMIICLWIMYGIAFSIVGVKNAIFFAIICGLLEIVPFVGNLIGNTLTILVSVAQGGDMNLVVGILITYGLVQFLQTYILEPLVVGAEVDINPVATIAGLVAGELLWGIPGMVLAIPILGITKIICDNIEPLKPYGYLIGEERKRKKRTLTRRKPAA